MEHIENSVHYICVKEETLNDQQILDELADLGVSNKNVVIDNETELLSTTMPNVDFDISTDASLEDGLSKTMDTYSSTFLPIFSPSTGFLINKVSTSLPNAELLCKDGYEGHKIEGTGDYECKVKISSPGQSPPQNQIGVKMESIPKKLDLQPAFPQSQSVNLVKFSCNIYNNGCCTIKPDANDLTDAPYLKYACDNNYAMTKMQIIGGKPVVECCKLPVSL